MVQAFFLITTGIGFLLLFGGALYGHGFSVVLGNILILFVRCSRPRTQPRIVAGYRFAFPNNPLLEKNTSTASKNSLFHHTLGWIDRVLLVAIVAGTVWLVASILIEQSLDVSGVAIALCTFWIGRIALRGAWFVEFFCRYGEGSFVQGVEKFAEEVASSMPNNSEWNKRLEMTAQLQLEGNLDEAEKSALELSADFPEVGTAHCLLGSACLGLGKADAAITSLTRALDLNPNDAVAYRCRGVAFAKVNRLSDAKVDLLTAVRIEGSHCGNHVSLGEACLRLGEFDQALASFEAALALEPNDEDACVGKIVALIELHRWSDASEEAQCLTRQKIPTGLSLCAWADAMLGHYQLAMSNFEKAIGAAKPGSGAYAFYGCAWLLSTCEDHRFRNAALAEKYATAAEEIGCLEDWQVAKLWAAIHAELGNWQLAIDSQQNAIRWAPNRAIEGLREQLASFQAETSWPSMLDNTGHIIPTIKW